MRPINLPAGLEDNGLEIYIHKGELRVIYNQRTTSFDLLPDNVKDIFTAHMFSNKSAVKSLKKDFSLEDANDMLLQYIKCNFGNFDMIPDADEDGSIYPECWDCGKRGTCPGEGKVCSRFKGPNGFLTKRETEILFLMIEGKLDKEIADHFGVTMPTIETQMKNIREALRCSNRIEVMNFAIRRKLI